MTSTVSCTDSDKDWFDEFKESEETQAEAFSRMVQQVKTFNGEPVDVEELADELTHTLVSKIELGAYRGALEAVERNDD
jgi:hypothetical protein